MSHDAMRWAWDAIYDRKDIPSTRRIVLLALAECHNGQTGQCNPSFDELVRMTGMRRETLTPCLHDLEQAGLVSIRRAHGTKSAYQLHIATSTEKRTSTENRTSTEKREEVVRKSVLTSKPGKNQEEKDKTPLTPQRPIDDLFADFWAAYPLKRSKGQAERTFAKLKPNEQLLAEILLGLQQAVTLDSRFASDEYTPHASTWLNAKGWQDEHDQGIPKPATSSAYGRTQGKRGKTVEQQNREAAQRAKAMLFGSKENVIEGVFSRERA